MRAVGASIGPVWVALTRGSWRLLGLGCRCLGDLAAGVWRAVSLDPTREAAARTKAVKAAEARQRKRAAAAKKAAKKVAATELDEDPDDEDEDPDEDEAAPIVLSARAEAAIRTASARPLWEALALLGLGGAVAAVGGAVLVRVAAGPATAWVGPVWDSWSGLITTGALTAWTTGALAVGPSLAEAEAILAARRTARAAKRHHQVEEPTGADFEQGSEWEEEQDVDGDVEQDIEEPRPSVDRGTALLLHVLRALSDAEAARRAGVHLDAVLASATDAGLVPAGTDVGELRRWLEGAGLPTKEIGMRIQGRPTTRVGVRVDAATAVLGMAPRALLKARSEATARTPGEAPAAAGATPTRVPTQPVGETPATVAPSTPAEAFEPAVLRLTPGGLPNPVQTLSPTPSKTVSQGAVRRAYRPCDLRV
ncbi:hypothetical protein [Streptomyces sp. NPDC048606]|uniref:hypothetical protein n=1 Tax=Streptomyces sp. NPDC048606 TaxID=3154726 RepID=UPI003447C19C